MGMICLENIAAACAASRPRISQPDCTRSTACRGSPPDPQDYRRVRRVNARLTEELDGMDAGTPECGIPVHQLEAQASTRRGTS